MISQNLSRRIAVAAVGIPLAIYLIFLGSWYLAATIAVLSVVGAAEFYAMAEKKGIRPIKVVGYGGTGLLPLGTYGFLSGKIDAEVLLLLAPLWVFLISIGALISEDPQGSSLSAVSITFWGAVYAGLLPSAIIVLRHGLETTSALAATLLVLLPLVLTWVCDTAAMVGGSLIGGKKLAPTVSPNKTWAGAVSGASAAVILAPLYGTLVLQRVGIDMPLPLLISIGLVVGILGQVGDLTESLFKREVGVKDSGSFFPGHGGVLDRLDSLYWVLPSTVMVIKLFGVA